MHCFTVVSQCFLCESLGISALLGPFRPGVTVTMQCDVHDAQADAAAFEFLSPILFYHQSKSWEQKPLGWQRPENRFNPRTKMNKRPASSFSASVRNDTISPVNAFCFQIGNVCL